MPSLWTTAKLTGHVVALGVLWVAVGGVDGIFKASDLKSPSGKSNTPDSDVSVDDPALTPTAAISQFRSLIDAINEPGVSPLRSRPSDSLAPLAEANRQTDRLEEMFAAFRDAVEEAAAKRGIPLDKESYWSPPSEAETN